MKIESNKFISTFGILEYFSKFWNISELTLQQISPKFMHLQDVAQLLLYILLVKLKCLNGKEKVDVASC